VHFQFTSCLWWWSRSRPLMPTHISHKASLLTEKRAEPNNPGRFLRVR
jgi:hypothetical protein